jgi:hypothetical protein
MPQYRAKEPIYIGWALAHPTGDPVPAANVEANGWHDLVDLVDEDAPPAPSLAPDMDDETSLLDGVDPPNASASTPTEKATSAGKGK